MNPIYTEKQKLMRWWIAAFLLPLPCYISYGFYQQAFLNIPFGEQHMPTFALGLFMIFMWSLCLYPFFVVLETIINQEGIFFRLSPTHTQFKKISWEDITSVKVDAYREKGEMNMYMAFFGTTDNVYKVFGWHAIEILAEDNEKWWIGTQTPEAAQNSLIEIRSEKLVISEE
ncbi:MAG: hypothetical protein AAFR66_02060 [Bacteroidota bacterium]